MTPLPSVVSEALLKAPAFELGLRRTPATIDRAVLRALEDSGLVELHVRWRRTVEGDRVAAEVAERKRRAA